jgi:A nuclease family of the HNH/ENDO VII superfamily with conserved AHH
VVARTRGRGEGRVTRLQPPQATPKPGQAPTRPRNVPEETFAQFPNAKNWQDVAPVIGTQASDLPPGYNYRRINQGTPEERLVIDRPRRNILEMGKPNENVPLHIADDGTIQVGFSPGAKRVSMPTLMRANFERAYGKVRPGYWIHHIIPDAVVRNNRMAQLARRLGFNLDRADNLVGLAGKDEWKALQQGGAKPPANGYSDAVGHWSSHPDYSAKVEAYLNREFQTLGQRYGNLDKALKNPKLSKQLKGDVEQIMRNTEGHFRDLIERGLVDNKGGRMSWNEQQETQPIA